MASDVFGFDEALKDLEKFEDLDKKTDKVLKDAAITCQAEAQVRTPVLTGTLRRGFEISNIEKHGDYKEIHVLNNVDYFEPVEEGHTIGGSGYYEGQHMLNDGYEIGKEQFEKDIEELGVGE